jgi:AcrR family transcriptional regulator
MGSGATHARRRDSAQARADLLDAAGQLFAEHGFDRTTVRDIGERAGLDAALIARYFGSKAGLYLAALKAEMAEGAPADLLTEGRLTELLDRVARHGSGPVFHAAVRPHADESVQQAAAQVLRERLVAPLQERFTRSGAARAQLRAEVAVAAVAGIVLGRGAGAFDALASVPTEELVPLVADLLGGLD